MKNLSTATPMSAASNSTIAMKMPTLKQNSFLVIYITFLFVASICVLINASLSLILTMMSLCWRKSWFVAAMVFIALIPVCLMRQSYSSCVYNLSSSFSNCCLASCCILKFAPQMYLRFCFIDLRLSSSSLVAPCSAVLLKFPLALRRQFACFSSLCGMCPSCPCQIAYPLA